MRNEKCKMESMRNGLLAKEGIHSICCSVMLQQMVNKLWNLLKQHYAYFNPDYNRFKITSW